MNSPWIGVIADDFTGATDVAAAIRRQGASVELAFGVPTSKSKSSAEALVVALKSRTATPESAVQESLQALDWLLQSGARRIYVKYCSTFDSTADGNIGPVIDAVAQKLGSKWAITTPASPEHGRTVYMGHLFVGQTLLSESSMATHPLTPMHDSNLQRVLASQTSNEVVSFFHGDLQFPYPSAKDDQSPDQTGFRHVIADAIDESDLDRVADIAYEEALSSGGAGLVGALARKHTRLVGIKEETSLQLPEGPAIIVAGSCSHTTLKQVAYAEQHVATFHIDRTSRDAEKCWGDLSKWLKEQPANKSVMVSASANADERDRLGFAFGPNTGEIIEKMLARAAGLRVKMGAKRVIAAGGETSGAVVQELGVSKVLVGHEAARGIPWCLSEPNGDIALLLKSGNFGTENLLERAIHEQP